MKSSPFALVAAISLRNEYSPCNFASSNFVRMFAPTDSLFCTFNLLFDKLNFQ